MAYGNEYPAGGGLAATGDRIAAHVQNIDALRSIHARLRDEVLPRIAGAPAVLAASPVPVPWLDDIVRRLNEALKTIHEFVYRVGELLFSSTLPLRLWETAEAWTRIRARMSGIAGDLGVTNREVHARWKGEAADMYDSIVPAHVGAATRLATVADAVPTALAWSATAIAVFYAALLGMLLEIVAALILAASMLVTIAGAPVGLVLLLTAGSGVVSQLGVLGVSLLEAVGRVRIWMTELLSEIGDTTAFPNGTWPLSRTEWYSDATVTDGDADWSVRS